MTVADDLPTLNDLKEYGWSPGGYMIRCSDCGGNGLDGIDGCDKRASRCKACATKKWQLCSMTSSGDALPKCCPFCGEPPKLTSAGTIELAVCLTADCAMNGLLIQRSKWNTRAMSAAQPGMGVVTDEMVNAACQSDRVWILWASSNSDDIRPRMRKAIRAALTRRAAPQAETRYKRPASHDIDSDNPPQAEGGG